MIEVEGEHYDAQVKFADILSEMLDISPWLHPIKRMEKYQEALSFRESHKKCCEWANEPI